MRQLVLSVLLNLRWERFFASLRMTWLCYCYSALGYSQLCASRSWVCGDLLFCRAYWTTCENFQSCVIAECLFHQTILKRMETDHGQPSARLQAVGQSPQRHF